MEIVWWRDRDELGAQNGLIGIVFLILFVKTCLKPLNGLIIVSA